MRIIITSKGEEILQESNDLLENTLKRKRLKIEKENTDIETEKVKSGGGFVK